MKNVGQILLQLMRLNEAWDGQAGRTSFAVIARPIGTPFVLISFNLHQSTKHVKSHGALFSIHCELDRRLSTSRMRIAEGIPLERLNTRGSHA